ncbi:hypothetical protein [Myceligenerans pegani]|uniref:Uncharacterized protein n=1 Tax=Myceligenerans pegani TaxID=2776917 RepID=A0ABR9N2H3_9MICO|nr:hypothetical protein [Myceligenerans sp. TRM 65318]MBE1877846.1 hypothetical protein [Myceligenerans sp. TRM 65318]MBE3020117.1 hypothetical protein [Myceligenerans sp. TRM 65318]
MATEQTTRETNRKAVEALEQSYRLVVVATDGVGRALREMEDLRMVTSVHAPVAGDLFRVRNGLLSVADNLDWRLRAERDGGER